MIVDTNFIIHHIRQQQPLPSQVVIPMVVVGELKAFALKSDWGYQKVTFLQSLINYYPLIDISIELIDLYAEIDAYSQGKLRSKPLPEGLSSRNMDKNDLWIATTALYFNFPLYTTDSDFDHLSTYGLQLKKPEGI